MTRVPVIIAAAGLSSRMRGVRKQFLEIAGVPVLARTLLAFERSRDISRIIVAAREEDIPEIQLLADKYMIKKLTDIVPGGQSRQHSVQNALGRLTAGETRLLIHDGARPLVPESVIYNVAAALRKHDAVTCGVKVKDTVKSVDKEGKVKSTLNREELVLVQTPQGVNVSVYKKAVEAAGDLSLFTDDMSIMESAGCDVFVVPGSYRNIKITTPDDVAAAAGLLNSEVWE